MQRFADLLDSLGTTQSRKRKIALLVAYFRTTGDPDRGWALAALAEGLPLRLPLRRTLLELMAERIDPVLYKLSRDYVGDTAETVSLLWPEKSQNAPPPNLDEVVAGVSGVTAAKFRPLLSGYLDRLDVSGRFALLKLLGGAPRVGVSSRLAKTAIAEAFDRDVAEIEEVWHALAPPYGNLFTWLVGAAPRPDTTHVAVFRPLMLAHPIEEKDLEALDPAAIYAEWKWDGIRVQLSAAGDDVRLFSRTGDDISVAFPEISAAFHGHQAVVDGELLVIRKGQIAPFNDLQQRLNRKVVGPKLKRDYPAHVRLYDMLIDGDDDLRNQPLSVRRARLIAWHVRTAPALSDVSSLVAFGGFTSLGRIWAGTRDAGIEGLMLKQKSSHYLAGRPKGYWWKWKRAPLTVDCVLMYAQRGSGKRSSFYSDYTFGVWRVTADRTRELVPVGKAYSGFTDAELKDLDRWVRAYTTERFGPVRAVAPGLVLEVAFDAVHKSARHKSGVAMRFPRVHRIRWDKPADEADTLDTIVALIA